MKLKKGDQVLVICGKDHGKRGTIEKVLTKENHLIISGINLAKHHLKPSRKNPRGGIMEKPLPIDVSNVIIICPRCSRPTRLGYKITENKDKRIKERICKKCRESVDKNDKS